MLEREYNVKTADTETWALEQARLTPIDVVVIDVHLGTEQAGLEVLMALRELPGYASVPIIALSRYRLDGAREYLMEVGFDEYLTKPCGRADLIQVMEKCMDAYAGPGHNRAPRPSSKTNVDLYQTSRIRLPD
jgi:CheY-like chemotaxis protein